MENLFIYIGKQGTLLKILVVILVLGIIFWFRKSFKNVYKYRNNDSMPPGLWFYSELINLEIDIKKANYKNLNKTFFKYLEKKYKITKKEIKTNTIFEIVNEKEKQENLINLYGLIWNKINDLKQKNNSDVIKCINDLKRVFIEDNIDEWIVKYSSSNKCNNC
jgi:hypothetical protein